MYKTQQKSNILNNDNNSKINIIEKLVYNHLNSNNGNICNVYNKMNIEYEICELKKENQILHKTIDEMKDNLLYLTGEIKKLYEYIRVFDVNHSTTNLHLSLHQNRIISLEQGCTLNGKIIPTVE